MTLLEAKKKTLVLAKVSTLIAAVLFALTYFLFHFVTDQGITLVWQPECGKPLVTLMVAIMGVLFLFAGLMSLLTAKIFFEE